MHNSELSRRLESSFLLTHSNGTQLLSLCELTDSKNSEKSAAATNVQLASRISVEFDYSVDPCWIMLGSTPENACKCHVEQKYPISKMVSAIHTSCGGLLGLMSSLFPCSNSSHGKLTSKTNHRNNLAEMDPIKSTTG